MREDLAPTRGRFECRRGRPAQARRLSHRRQKSPQNLPRFLRRAPPGKLREREQFCCFGGTRKSVEGEFARLSMSDLPRKPRASFSSACSFWSMQTACQRVAKVRRRPPFKLPIE